MSEDERVGELSDEDLALRAAEGSRAACEELVLRFTPRLFRFLRPKAASDQDVEDLIQDSFLKTFRSIGRYDPKWRFSTWLYTTAYRLAVSRWRSPKTESLSFSPVAQDPGPQEAYDRQDSVRRVWELARELNRSQFQALWLRYAEDLSVKEMARVMKKTPINVRVLLHRARLNLSRAADSVLFADADEETGLESGKIGSLEWR